MTLFAELVFFISLLSIVSPYILYPVTVVILARLRGPRPEPADGTPTVTLLISAFNEAQVIQARFGNFCIFDYLPDPFPRSW